MARAVLRAAVSAAWVAVALAPTAHAQAPAAASSEEVQETEPAGAREIRYFVERVEITGNTATAAHVIRSFVPLARGDVLDVDAPEIEAIRWRLLGTGWFRDVRLHLRRGGERGWVVLVVDVREQNTLVVQQVAAGLSQGLRGTTDRSTDLVPYLGLALAETNALGAGVGVFAAALLSKPQQGVWVGYNDPFFLGSPFDLHATAFYNNAREFFGDDDARVSIVCPPIDPADPEPDDCPPEVAARSAVVFYERVGLRLGTGRDVTSSLRYRLEWQGELVEVPVRPEAASERRGDGVAPIDFAIEGGGSRVSAARLELVHDHRDNPALTSRGLLVRFEGMLASRLLGSDYDFLRLQVLLRRWIALPWGGHSVRFGVLAGVVFGNAPFFHKFHASDLSDLIPSRVLEMNIDRRAPPNLLGTAIEEMRSEELALRADVEYGLPLYRVAGHERAAFRGLEAYLGGGLYALADHRDLRRGIPGYRGLSALPIDLTFDVGLRAETVAGVFQLGFSTILGFVAP